MTNQYDTIIIGAGQNNLTLAPLLRERGMQPLVSHRCLR